MVAGGHADDRGLMEGQFPAIPKGGFGRLVSPPSRDTVSRFGYHFGVIAEDVFEKYV